MIDRVLKRYLKPNIGLVVNDFLGDGVVGVARLVNSLSNLAY